MEVAWDNMMAGYIEDEKDPDEVLALLVFDTGKEVDKTLEKSWRFVRTKSVLRLLRLQLPRLRLQATLG